MESASFRSRAIDSSVRVSHIRAIDGLRAISVLSVIAFHAGVPGLGGGFIGVEIFFVISGFLITNLLCREFERASGISLKNFYMRRILRLIPALAFFLSVFLTLSAAYFGTELFKFHLTDAIVTLLYSQNWAWAYGLKEPGLLAHTWSLSIEEQFYIVWPLLLIGIFRFRGMRPMLSLVALLAGIVFTRTAVLAEKVPWIELYLGTDTRSGALLIGCCLGIVVRNGFRVSEGERRLLSWLSPAATMTLAYFFIAARPSNPGMYQFGFLLIALSAAVILLDLTTSSNSWLAKLLGTRWLVWIGMLSYGLYIWHYPIIVMLEPHYNWQATFIIGTTVTFVMAAISYYAIERRFLRMKHRYRESKGFNAIDRAPLARENRAGRSLLGNRQDSSGNSLSGA